MSIIPDFVLPATPACPNWCTRHDIEPESDGALFVVHHGAPLDLDGRVRLRQGVYVQRDGRTDTAPVEIVLDGDELPLGEAHRLIAGLALAATCAESAA
jgi:hypothetical protein